MALGGGTFLVQNKVLPGAYINVISMARADATLADRGTATMGLELDWGPDGEVFEVKCGDLQKNSLKLFGYDYTNDKLKGLRDLFTGGTKMLYAYRLNSGIKAKSTISEASCSGIRGNDIWHSVAVNVDDETLYDVQTYWDTKLMDSQTVASAAELTDIPHVVTFDKKAALEATAKIKLTGGTNGTVDGSSHQDYLDHIEPYSYNTIGVCTTEETVKKLYVAFNKRMRDEVGVKSQCVVYSYAADYEGAVNVKNKVVADDIWSEASLVYWVTGVIASCAINASNTNKKYNGDFDVIATYTKSELEKAIKAGEFTLHQVGSDIRVLMDINSLVTTTLEKGSIFRDNKVVRIADQIANDTAALFAEKYLGVVPNGKDGRISLWNDIVKLRNDMQKIGAIENFTDDMVTVEEGDGKNDVAVTDGPLDVVGTMEKLYMTTILA